jgi:hypothetical protein
MGKKFAISRLQTLSKMELGSEADRTSGSINGWGYDRK